MSSTDMAPVLVVTYDRLVHLQKTITSLRNNTHADQTDLYIASDYQRSEAEADKVAAVRSYLKTIDGFKSVTVFVREKNFGVVENIVAAFNVIFEKFDRFIFMEDDNVTAPGFLQFMNDAFEFYKDDPRIGSISAYCPPFKFPDSYPNDVFALVRLNPWGVGFWKRYNKMDTPISEVEYHKIFNVKKRIRMLARSVGEEALPIIRKDFEGKINTGDMKIIFWQFVDGKLTIYPRKSLVQNIGQDGSGFRMPITDKWDVSEVWDKKSRFEFVRDITVDERIRRAHFNFYKTHDANAKAKIIGYLLKIGIYQYLRPIIKIIKRKLKSNHSYEKNP